jgi:hypothetical protein
MKLTIEELLESILRDIGERDKVYIHTTTIQGLLKRPPCNSCEDWERRNIRIKDYLDNIDKAGGYIDYGMYKFCPDCGRKLEDRER